LTETSDVSIFENKSLSDIHREIKEVYLSDERPWIIGFSGGKDSTAALQLVWYALAELSPSERRKPIFVISSDTLVETPIIVDHIDSTLDRINLAAHKQSIPFRAEKVRPIVSETFWVNLIGKGYPAPQTQFRWCTERMKIRPADRFILEKVSKHGEVVLVLGVRRSESMTRAQVMSLREIKGTILSRHSKFQRAFVYTPIRDFSLDDVWSYLLQTPSPWGNNNRDLLALYQSANSGECPLVVDESTPSCGNSRFGCWVCTVVAQDKTMAGLIDSGHEWMQPLLEIRNFLAATQDPSKKLEFREYKRRTGTVDTHRNGSGSIIPGPYKFEFRQEILRRVLTAQIEVRKTGPDKNLTLLGPEELHEIRRLWRTELGDWEDTLPKIYQEVTGQELPWIRDDIGCFTGEDARYLETICNEKGVPPMLIRKLITAEIATQGMKRRSSIYPRIDRILREDWRSKEEVLDAIEKDKFSK
jgi:DNA sulfur modification protein DndC